PNTGLGHNSQVFMIEAQVRYVVGALAHARRHGIDRIEVRRGAQSGYDRVLRRKMARTVWVTGGCKSWYLDAEGRNVTLWPDFSWVFARQTRRFDPASYDLARSSLAGSAAGNRWPGAERSLPAVRGACPRYRRSVSRSVSSAVKRGSQPSSFFARVVSMTGG